MNNSFLLLAVGAFVLVAGAVRNNNKVHSALTKHLGTHYLPQAVTMLIVTAQISELIRVIEHVSIVNVVAALFLLSIVVATKSGTESELR